MRQQIRNQQMQMQSPHIAHPHCQYQQAAPHPINQFAHPSNQPYIHQQVQMGRPPRAERQMAQRPYSQEREYPQEVRGRPHESCMMREQPQAQNQYVDAQIRFHETELMRLKAMVRREEPVQMMRREEPVEMMRREVPINTSESLESQQPIRRKPIPVGRPLYEKDANSSFASEYPEI